MSGTAGSSGSTEVEASSFSIWNCVITFLQVLLISTMLYGSGWNQGQMYNLSPDNVPRIQHHKALAFFFCVWALQSLALALFLVWAIGKKSYHLCHSWMLSEALMQIFIVLSATYFTYRHLLRSRISDTNVDLVQPQHTTEYSTIRHSHDSLRLPKHLVFLIILHFLIKGFGFWIVSKYMRLLKTTGIESFVANASSNSTSSSAAQTSATCNRDVSPPPAYSNLCKDDLPCYDEAVRLSLEDNDKDANNQGHCCNSKVTDKTVLVQEV